MPERKRPTSQVVTDRQASIRDDDEWRQREEDKHELTCFTREGERGVEGKGGRRGLGKGTHPGRWSSGRRIEGTGDRWIKSRTRLAMAGGSNRGERRLELREERASRLGRGGVGD